MKHYCENVIEGLLENNVHVQVHYEGMILNGVSIKFDKFIGPTTYFSVNCLSKIGVLYFVLTKRRFFDENCVPCLFENRCTRLRLLVHNCVEFIVVKLALLRDQMNGMCQN